jgi:hypothetical protein
MDLTINQNVDFVGANEQQLIDWLDAHLPTGASQRGTLEPNLPMAPISQWDWLSPGRKYY